VLYPYKIQVVQMLTAANRQRRREFFRHFLQFVQLCPATSDPLWFSDKFHLHIDRFVKKEHMRFWTSKNAHRVVETSLNPAKCTVW